MSSPLFPGDSLFINILIRIECEQASLKYVCMCIKLAQVKLY